MHSATGVSFVVFFRNLKEEPIKTTKKIQQAMSELPDINFEIILLRDGGEKNYFVEKFLAETYLPNTVKYIELCESLGVAGAFAAVIESVKHSHTCLVPGNNPFTATSYINVTRNFETHDAVLGYRTNLMATRPLPKVIASYCLMRLIRLIFRPKLNYIKDFHGLNLFRTAHIARFVKYGSGHGIQISLIIPIYFLNGSFHQVPVFNNMMRNGIKDKFLKFPQLKHIVNVTRDLIRLKKTYPFRGIEHKF